MRSLPTSVPQLIKELDQQFPNACPSLADADREVWFKAGQRAAVEHLLARLKADEEDERRTKKG